MAKLTDPQIKKKEKIVKAMKKNRNDFKKRYGDEAKSVMYATATDLAKKEHVEWSVEFDIIEDAYSFANKLKSYNISDNDSIHREYDGSVSVVFESDIQNDNFIEWLAEKHDADGCSLIYENFLPGDLRITEDDSELSSFRQFSSFVREKNEDYVEAYKKTTIYKSLNSANKKAIDHFMGIIENEGIESMDKAVKQTSKKFSIPQEKLDDFLEAIFFAEDIAYMKRLVAEAKDNEDIQKDREDAAKTKRQEKDDKEDAEQEKKKEDGKDVSKSDTNASDDDSGDSENASDGNDGSGGSDTTFKNFKSKLKDDSEKGKGSSVNVDNDNDKEEKIKLEKPKKGSPIEDPEMSDIGEAKVSKKSINDLKPGDWFGIKNSGTQFRAKDIKKDSKGNVTKVSRKDDVNRIIWHPVKDLRPVYNESKKVSNPLNRGDWIKWKWNNGTAVGYVDYDDGASTLDVVYQSGQPKGLKHGEIVSIKRSDIVKTSSRNLS